MLELQNGRQQVPGPPQPLRQAHNRQEEHPHNTQQHYAAHGQESRGHWVCTHHSSGRRRNTIMCSSPMQSAARNREAYNLSLPAKPASGVRRRSRFSPMTEPEHEVRVRSRSSPGSPGSEPAPEPVYTYLQVFDLWIRVICGNIPVWIWVPLSSG